jgi:two-component system osmolarity sensor histidine kinase EnvZ
LIIFRLTRQLRILTHAACAIGPGEPPGKLDEAGPREIWDLTKGFNQMTVDLNRLDSDRRLMLAGISHDLQTPLTRLRTALELAALGTEAESWSGM